MSGITVNFKFNVGDKVETPFSDMGIVESCNFDLSGPQYFIKTKSNSGWFRESELSELDKK